MAWVLGMEREIERGGRRRREREREREGEREVVLGLGLTRVNPSVIDLN